MPFTFANPYMLFLVAAILPVLWLASRRRKALGHSQLDIHANVKKVPFIGRIPVVLLVGFWVLLIIALARPQLPNVGEKEVFDARDVVIAADISGSMTSGKIQDPAQVQFVEGEGDKKPDGYKIIEVAEKAIDAFIELRQGDRVGLLLFDDEVYYSWPLSRDLRVIKYKNVGMSKYSGGGTNFDGDGKNSKMGPIQASIEHFRELGQARSKILVMVTDGESSISDQRFTEIMSDFRELNIKLYILGVGDSWVKGGSSTQDLRKLTEASGGIVITVGDAEQMRQGLARIDELEKSQVYQEKSLSFLDIYQYFILAGIAAAILFLVGSAIVREAN